MKNICLLTDSYKVGHYLQYPPKTKKVFSYFESRSKGEMILFFGLQMILKKYFQGKVVDPKKIREAESVWTQHFSFKLFSQENWEHILYEHDGELPLEIKAVPEGTLVNSSNVLFTVENTCEACYWLVSWVETLLVQVWYPTTVATRSKLCKNIILDYLERTGDPSQIDFKLHDFGFRGVSSVESAGLGGAAHLINFMGTDTIHGVTYLQRYYNTKVKGFSIPAAEHSTITSWGQENEVNAFDNMLEKFPTEFVAVVSDSYDIFNACRNLWGEKLRDKVLERDGILVIRPDSGDPGTVLWQVLEILGEKFGYTTNSKGYKELHPKVKIIYGDGINLKSLNHILFFVCNIKGWSSNNFAFGMGGGLLQQLDRDTYKFALKCSYIETENTSRDVFKNPVTADGGFSKASKAGRLKLIKKDGNFVTCREEEPGENQLITVFKNGVVFDEANDFDKIVERSNIAVTETI